MSAKTEIVNPPEGRVVYVGQTIRVPWSNGAGASLYRVDDPPGAGPHVLTKLAEYEEPFSTVHRCINVQGRSHWFVWPDFSSTAVLTTREADEAEALYKARGVHVVHIRRPVYQPSQTAAEYVAALAAWLRVVQHDADELETLAAWTQPLNSASTESDRTLSDAQRAEYRREFGVEVDRG